MCGGGQAFCSRFLNSVVIRGLHILHRNGADNNGEVLQHYSSGGHARS